MFYVNKFSHLLFHPFLHLITTNNGYLKLYELAINILILVISQNWWDGGVALQQGLIISQNRGAALPHGQHPTATGLVRGTQKLVNFRKL